MRPTKSILDESFAYTPAVATTVAETWRRFGWLPTSEQERAKRRFGTSDARDARVVELASRRSA